MVLPSDQGIEQSLPLRERGVRVRDRDRGKQVADLGAGQPLSVSARAFAMACSSLSENICSTFASGRRLFGKVTLTSTNAPLYGAMRQWSCPVLADRFDCLNQRAALVSNSIGDT